MIDNNDGFRAWLKSLVDTVLPFDLQKKIALGEKLAEHELVKFLRVIELAGMSKGLEDHKDIKDTLSRVETKLLGMNTTLNRIDDRTRNETAAKKEIAFRQEGENLCLEYWEDYDRGRLGDKVTNARPSHKDLLKFPLIKAKLAKYGICTENDIERAIKNAQRRKK